MNTLIFLLALANSYIVLAKAEDWCVKPFEKINDDICILLNSGVKSRSHSRHVCNYFKSNLLYINSDVEQKFIQDFFATIKKYRFNMQPFIWLDAVQDKDDWVWSRNNRKLEYNNWQKKVFDVYWFNSLFFTDPADMVKEPSYGICGCFEVSDSVWKNCDCDTIQHYVCRKEKPIEYEIKKSSLRSMSHSINNTIHDTSNSFQKEEDSITISERILMDDEDNTVKNSTNLTSTSTIENKTVNAAVVSEKTVKTIQNFVMDSSEFVNIFRKKVTTSSDPESQFAYECPKGLGYYLIRKNDCSMYKKCEYWDGKFSIVTLNKCSNERVFNIETFQCVEKSSIKCDHDSPQFVSTGKGKFWS